jgi:CheY-like chemotaxis protein
VPIVLIADDDADHRELISLTLRRSGHEVITAVDGPSAMTVLLAGGVDAALLDVRMPGEDGIELCRRLRAEPSTASLPIMLISADVNDHQIRAALRAGADDYLAKPFPRAELCARLDNLLLDGGTPAIKLGSAAAAARLAARPARPPIMAGAQERLRRTA